MQIGTKYMTKYMMFNILTKVAVMNSKEGDHINHYDYVLCPDGKKRKIYSFEDIEKLQGEWEEYCERNWINGGKAIFDPESKVKFMLDGLSNIILRNHIDDGILTEYKKMKIGKYEIPLSVCASALGNEFYSEREKIDNGEEMTKMEAMMEEAARKYDEALIAKNSKKRQKEIASKKKKVFPLTRRQKIEKIRKEHDIVHFEFCVVDVENMFRFQKRYYHIPSDNPQYAPKVLKDGDVVYDMDQVLCAETSSGEILFFDMNIDPIDGIELKAEQMSFA